MSRRKSRRAVSRCSEPCFFKFNKQEESCELCVHLQSLLTEENKGSSFPWVIKGMEQPMTDILSHPTNGLHKNLDR